MSGAGDQSGPFVIRLAAPGDLAGFFELAKLTGPGFTTLIADEKKLTQLLEASERAAKGEPGSIMLALEDLSTGRIAGCAAVKRGGKKRAGFANFQVQRDKAGKPQSLTITDAYRDLTEIGGLFVHPDYRSMGVGKALAQSRYLYVAAAPQTFGAQLFAELRGVIDEDGVSPFYDAACKPSLRMTFAEADRLCAAGENDRLVAGLPKAPISTKGFPAEAISAIGGCHTSGRAAQAMLAREGFRFEGVVDLLDGGALVAVETAALASLKESRLLRIKPSGLFPKTASLLFATAQPDGFRCVAGRGAIIENMVMCCPETAAALEVAEDAIVRVTPLASREAVNETPSLSPLHPRAV